MVTRFIFKSSLFISIGNSSLHLLITSNLLTSISKLFSLFLLSFTIPFIDTTDSNFISSGLTNLLSITH